MRLIVARHSTVVLALAAAAFGCGGSWEHFTSESGRFRVSMPGQPEEQVQKAQTPDGPTDVHWFGLTPRPWWPAKPVMYLVSYVEVPHAATPTRTEEQLSAARDRLSELLARDLQMKLEEERRDTFKGHPAVDLTFGRGDGTIAHAKAVIVSDRVYSLAVAGPREQVASASEGMRFLESFEVI